MQQIRIGVIGIGHLGKYHLQKYQGIDECTIVGVADIVEDCTLAAAQRYGCSRHSDHRELIGKVDAVSIAVPTRAHFATARDFLANGIDVLLEKPITQTLDQADELIRIAKDQGAVLQIGFVERFNPAVATLAQFLERPLFIEAHRLHPFVIRGTDVDVILDLMIHDLDIILHFVRSPVARLDATGVSVLSDKVDIANARVTFENGCVANITASRVTGKTMQKIRFFSDESYNSVDYAKRELESFSRKFDSQGQPGIIKNSVNIEQYDALEAEIRAFVRSVRTRRQPAVTAEQGRESLALGLQISDTIREKLEKLRP